MARDLGSTNGSMVNGERLTEPRILRSGDRITAGQVTLLYRDAGKQATDAVVFTDERLRHCRHPHHVGEL